MIYEVTLPDGSVNRIVASQEFLEAEYPGRYIAVPSDDISPSLQVPSEITMQQARQVLNARGLVPFIDALIDAMDEPARSKAHIAWEYSNTVQRHFGLVSQLAPHLGLDDAEIDEMFIEGAQIP